MYKRQISDRGLSLGEKYIEESFKKGIETIVSFGIITIDIDTFKSCLLYTSDAADEEDSVDLGGRRIIKKKKK
nr:hypothetical protein [Clostridioides difficile]